MSKLYHLYFAACVPEGGVYHYTLQDGKLTFLKKTDMPSPMYLDVTKEDMEVVLQKPDGKFSALQNFPLSDYELQAPGPRQSTEGREGCHLCRFEGNYYVANYSSGSVFCSTGKSDVHEGQGPDPIRQEKPHTHFTKPTPDGKYLFCVDLGLDTIFTYDKDLNILSTAKVPGGYGCRHLAYSEDGKTVFCANELDGSVSYFAYEDGKLTYIDTAYMYDVHPLPGNTTGAIRVLGDYVYASNRSRGDISNDITCLHWDGEKLVKVSRISSYGESPRDLLIVDGLMFVTNERTNNVTIYRVDGAKMEKLPEELSMPNPLCVVALEA